MDQNNQQNIINPDIVQQNSAPIQPDGKIKFKKSKKNYSSLLQQY